jgi:putative SOS response-associated peptidase YedK
MCGRYTLTRPAAEVAAEFAAGDPPATAPRYNVAPTQPALVVRRAGERRQCSLLRWGLVPPWSESPSGSALINAMSETAAGKRTFRDAFRRRRCLVPADGFFEWLAEGKKRHPYLFALADGGLFAFAGLWEAWEKEGERLESVCILTTEANELVRPLHDRMPVILPRQAHDLWLDPAVDDPNRLQELLRPFPAALMAARAVSAAVNSVKNEGPQCVAPAEPAGPSQTSLF